MDLKIAGLDIKYIQWDSSGENKLFYNACHAKGYNIKFEFSGPRTPHHIGNLARKFRIFYSRIRVFLNSAGLENSEDGAVLIGIYVNDCLDIGDEVLIAKLIVGLKKMALI